jgi:metal-responsive CopG/Arc/MetJ family transcriptional regulator
MSKTKIAISLDPNILTRLDELVEEDSYKSRSQAVEEAIEEKLNRKDGNRLIRETAKLDPEFEKSLAEEGMSEELGEWPTY